MMLFTLVAMGGCEKKEQVSIERKVETALMEENQIIYENCLAAYSNLEKSPSNNPMAMPYLKVARDPFLYSKNIFLQQNLLENLCEEGKTLTAAKFLQIYLGAMKSSAMTYIKNMDKKNALLQDDINFIRKLYEAPVLFEYTKNVNTKLITLLNVNRLLKLNETLLKILSESTGTFSTCCGSDPLRGSFIPIYTDSSKIKIDVDYTEFDMGKYFELYDFHLNNSSGEIPYNFKRNFKEYEVNNYTLSPKTKKFEKGQYKLLFTSKSIYPSREIKTNQHTINFTIR